ncbi:MAG: TMEM43 family protein [Elainella sp.]
MADQYREVRYVSWGEKIGGSCLGTILGLALFVGSFFVLVWNEGMVDLSQLARTAPELSASVPNPAAEGKLVTLTGPVTSSQPLGDDLFLRPGNYIFVDRTVEMYGWKEDQQIKTTKHFGGSETQETIYTYSKQWLNNPSDSSRFARAAEHSHPPKAIADQLFRASNAQIGLYQLDPAAFSSVLNHRTSCTEDAISYQLSASGINLPPGPPLSLTAQNTRLSQGAKLISSYIYQGTGTPQSPQVGDLRICYTALPASTTVTAVAQLQPQNRLQPYLQDDTRIYRMLLGSRAEAITSLKTEHRIWSWLFRGLGFLMMWLGLFLFAAPVSAILDFIPILGDLSSAVAGVASFLIAFVLSAVTILTASLLQSPLVLAGSVGVTLLALLLMRQLRRA